MMSSIRIRITKLQLKTPVLKKNKKSSSKSHANNNAASGTQMPVGDPVMLSTEGKLSFEIEPQFCYPRKIDDIVKSAKFIALHIGEWAYSHFDYTIFHYFLFFNFCRQCGRLQKCMSLAPSVCVCSLGIK